MKKRFLFKIAVLGACLTLPVSSAYAAETGTPALPLPPLSGEAAEVLTALAGANMASLAFDPSSYTDETLVVNGKPVAFRAYRSIPYAALPKDAARQRMSIFIPAAYLTGGTINGYTAKTAPIFLPNGVGGYMPGEIQEPTERSRMTGTPNASLIALSRGLVVAAPAIRGRTDKDASGSYIGKAPSLVVDYKAAVQYLRYNAARLPAGNTDRIIANGTSAGGALSALLGATGGSADYADALAEIGAAGGRDDIYAASCYCPITDLDHADMAYEWIFAGVNDYHQSAKGSMPPAASAASSGNTAVNRPLNAPAEGAAAPMTEEQSTASARLKELYPAYLNSLGLKDASGSPMLLNPDGTGSFAEYVKALYQASAQSALDRKADLGGADWFTVRDGKAANVDLAKYAAWATRLKAAPAFDKLDRSSGENDVFGTTANVPRHFTDFARRYDPAHADLAPDADIRRMNPLGYIGTAGVKTAPHFRIRHGAKDRDTALAVPAVLALRLQNAGIDVDFAVPWGQGHGGDYDLDELFNWIDRICK